MLVLPPWLIRSHFQMYCGWEKLVLPVFIEDSLYPTWCSLFLKKTAEVMIAKNFMVASKKTVWYWV